jgi:hypothetical protein
MGCAEMIMSNPMGMVKLEEGLYMNVSSLKIVDTEKTTSVYSGIRETHIKICNHVTTEVITNCFETRVK